MTEHEYNQEILAICQSIVEEINQEIEEPDHSDYYDRLHETIDGHQWVIYYRYHLDVLKHSRNAEHGLDEGLIHWNSEENHLGELHTQLTYWAMYADCMEYMDDTIEQAA